MRPNLLFRNKSDTISVQIERKSLIVICLLFLCVILSVVVGTGIGNTMITPLEVILTIFGRGSGEYDFIIQTLRLPRVLASLFVGAALGISGAILQGMIRNPLASPDIIGITSGASFAAVAFIIAFHIYSTIG